MRTYYAHIYGLFFVLSTALQLFPGSDWVAANAALAHYNMRNFDEAQALYEDLLARDPARLAVSCHVWRLLLLFLFSLAAAACVALC
jgi:tetratricopeptide (TPR) repeat protein